MKHSSGILA